MNNFDPLIHKPPRLDRYGFNTDPMSVRNMLNRQAKNILTEKIDIPKWWSGKVITSIPSPKDEEKKPEGATQKSRSASMTQAGFGSLQEKMTRTKLIEKRKKEALPDLTYDLDGDGFVGGRDYMVARRFDKGNKNYLTKDERESVFKALAEVSFFLTDVCRVMKTNSFGTSKLLALCASIDFFRNVVKSSRLMIIGSLLALILSSHCRKFSPRLPP